MMKWKQRELEFKTYIPTHGDEHYWVIENIVNLSIVGSQAVLNDGRGCRTVQYTGVKDINGKKIFEGDIVRFSRDRLIPGRNMGLTEVTEEHVGVVCFIKGQYLIKTTHGEYSLYCASCDEPSEEILGNVFQNPELVEKYKLEIE